MSKRPHSARQKPAASAPAEKPADLQALITAEREKRTAACMAEIQAALKKHRCVIMPRLTFVGKDLSADWGVRALDA